MPKIVRRFPHGFSVPDDRYRCTYDGPIDGPGEGLCTNVVRRWGLCLKHAQRLEAEERRHNRSMKIAHKDLIIANVHRPIGGEPHPFPKSAQRRHIVKIQTPLVTNEPTPLALIYNEDRSVMVQTPVTGPLLARMAGKPKGYFFANLDAQGNIEIDGPAPAQAW